MTTDTLPHLSKPCMDCGVSKQAPAPTNRCDRCKYDDVATETPYLLSGNWAIPGVYSERLFEVRSI